MTAWKVRRLAHAEAPGLSADTQVFAAARLGSTFQLTGQLRLTKAEADELEAKLTGTIAPLAPEEFDKVWQALVGISDAEERRAAAKIMERFKR